MPFLFGTPFVDYKFVLIEQNIQFQKIEYGSLTCSEMGLYTFLFEAVSIVRKPEKQMSRRKVVTLSNTQTGYLVLQQHPCAE